MNLISWKAFALVLTAALLIGLGAAGGARLSSEQYAPQLQENSNKLAACTAAGGTALRRRAAPAAGARRWQPGSGGRVVDRQGVEAMKWLLVADGRAGGMRRPGRA